MAVTPYGLAKGNWTTIPGFNPRRDANGMHTARCSFAMRRDSWEEGLSTIFKRNTPIGTLFVELGSSWDFLVVDEVELEFAEGAIQYVHCDFKGFATAEFDENNRDVTYTLSGAMAERSILLNPLYRTNVTGLTDRVVIEGALNGRWKVDEINTTADDYRFLDTVNLRNQTPYSITDVNVLKWCRLIFEEGMKTYRAPTRRWTMDTANKDGLEASDLEFLGLVQYGGDGQEAVPPGDPPVPQSGGPWEWMLITAGSQESTISGVSTSRTWELGPPGGFPKFKDDAGAETSDGPYNYDLALIV